MGAHYQSIHFRSTDATAVHAFLTRACAGKELCLWVAPPSGPWISAFPNDMLVVKELCAAASREIACDVLYTILHDSDLFAYTLYQGGQSIDEFCSDPDYFKPASDAERQHLAGQPEKLAALVTTPAGVERLRNLLGAPDDLEAETTMRLFMDELGITQFLSDYQYLEGGERDTVTNWKEFVHVPDRAAEKATARQVRAQRKARLKDWVASGALIYDHELAKRGQRLDYWKVFEPDPKGGGFFITSMEPWDDSPAQRWLPPAPPIPAPGVKWDPIATHDFSLQHPAKPFVFRRDQGDLAILDAGTRRVVRRLKPTNPQLLARKRALWDAAGGQHIPDSHLERDELMGGALSPDGSLLFLGTRDGLRVHRTDAILAATDRLPAPVGGFDTTFAIDDAGHIHGLLVLPETEVVLYTLIYDDTVRQYHWPTGKVQEFAPGFGGWGAFSLTRSGNGQLLACSMRELDRKGKLAEGFAIRVWDLAKLLSKP